MDTLPFRPGDLCVYKLVGVWRREPIRVELVLIVSVSEIDIQGHPRVEWTEIVDGVLSKYSDTYDYLRDTYTVVGAARP